MKTADKIKTFLELNHVRDDTPITGKATASLIERFIKSQSRLPEKEQIVQILKDELEEAWIKGMDAQEIGMPSFDMAYKEDRFNSIANQILFLSPVGRKEEKRPSDEDIKIASIKYTQDFDDDYKANANVDYIHGAKDMRDGNIPVSPQSSELIKPNSMITKKNYDKAKSIIKRFERQKLCNDCKHYKKESYISGYSPDHNNEMSEDHSTNCHCDKTLDKKLIINFTHSYYAHESVKKPKWCPLIKTNKP